MRDDESYEIDEGELEDLEEQEHNISQFDDNTSFHFFTKVNYHYATMLDYYEENNFEQEMSMPEICQEVPQKSYGLRSRVKHAAQAKKVVKHVPFKQRLPLEKKQVVHENIDKVVVPEEVNKGTSGFNLEHEINKIKIHVPLTELIKNKSYMEATFKSAVNSIPSDEINL